MVWQKNTIKLGAAQRIFASFNVREVEVGDKVVGYQADIAGGVLAHTSLTDLCACLVDTLLVGEKTFKQTAEQLAAAEDQ
ncbi:MAG: hypothetical protein AAGF66_21205 [Cyanobacteria bacterium P01_H01_bin.119]